jgi:hypothetical protein
MDAKLDSMAQSGALDPALLLTIAKAHSSVKDTDYTREEVKDVMAHLYFKVSTAQHSALYRHATVAANAEVHCKVDSIITVAAASPSCQQVAQPSCICFVGHAPAVFLPNLPPEYIMSIATTASSELFSRQGVTCTCAQRTCQCFS